MGRIFFCFNGSGRSGAEHRLIFYGNSNFAGNIFSVKGENYFCRYRRQKERILTMTNLKCYVQNCIHNSPDRCCKPDIQVDGPCACGCEQTCCASFEMQNGKGQASNSCGCSVPNDSLLIRCSASNCVYNEKGECSAETINISPCGCSTPDCKSQTECASFRMR